MCATGFRSAVAFLSCLNVIRICIWSRMLLFGVCLSHTWATGMYFVYVVHVCGVVSNPTASTSGVLNVRSVVGISFDGWDGDEVP